MIDPITGLPLDAAPERVAAGSPQHIPDDNENSDSGKYENARCCFVSECPRPAAFRITPTRAQRRQGGRPSSLRAKKHVDPDAAELTSSSGREFSPGDELCGEHVMALRERYIFRATPLDKSAHAKRLASTRYVLAYQKDENGAKCSACREEMPAGDVCFGVERRLLAAGQVKTVWRHLGCVNIGLLSLARRRKLQDLKEGESVSRDAGSDECSSRDKAGPLQQWSGVLSMEGLELKDKREISEILETAWTTEVGQRTKDDGGRKRKRKMKKEKNRSVCSACVAEPLPPAEKRKKTLNNYF